MGGDEIVAEPVQLLGGHARRDMFGDHVQRFRRQPASGAHRREILRFVNRDPA
jgi:hypothetical protein